MSTTTRPTLSRNDTTLLSEAVSQPHGRIALSKTMTPLVVKRTLARLLKRGFMVAKVAPETAGEAGYELTPAGYEAVGMTPPALVHPAVTDDAATLTPMSKRAHVLALEPRGGRHVGVHAQQTAELGLAHTAVASEHRGVAMPLRLRADARR